MRDESAIRQFQPDNEVDCHGDLRQGLFLYRRAAYRLSNADSQPASEAARHAETSCPVGATR